jgi:hypothetical protein
MTLKEKIDNRFPALSKFISELLTRRKNTTFQDILLCAAVTAACAFYEFEHSLADVIGDTIRAVLLILFVVIWLWSAFVNGIWQKYSFLVFTALFWLIPRIFIVWHGSIADIRDYNEYLHIAAEYSSLLVDFSLAGLSGLMNASELLTTFVLFSWIALAFYAGRLIKKGN